MVLVDLIFVGLQRVVNNCEFATNGKNRLELFGKKEKGF